jgi:phosphohistidine swiveling domain-containing protein
MCAVHSPESPLASPSVKRRWRRDAAHQADQVPLLHAEAFARQWPRGMAYARCIYGGAELQEWQHVHGYMYRRPTSDAADLLLGDKPWREELARWHSEILPRSRRVHGELAAVDVSTLTDAELSQHFGACLQALNDGIFFRSQLTRPAVWSLVAINRRIASMVDAPLDTVAGALVEASLIPEPEELTALAAALHDDADGTRLLQDSAPTRVLDGLVSLPGETGRAARAFVRCIGYWVTRGYDCSAPYALETPGVLVDRVRRAVDKAGGPRERVPFAFADAIPSANRREFEELWAEVPELLTLKEYRGHYTQIWASGLLRRALLEIARRVEPRGLIDHFQDLFAVTADEVRTLLARSPTADEMREIRARRAEWRAAVARDTPMFLDGDEDTVRSAVTQMPAGVGSLVLGISETTEDDPEGPGEPGALRVLRGRGIGQGTYEGIAHVVTSPADLEHLPAGAVAVLASQSCSETRFMAQVGALVSDTGGVLSHVAIIARERRIPAVVGTRHATRHIATGDRVLVNAAAGRVTLLRGQRTGPRRFEHVENEAGYGGKAYGLGVMCRSGIAVPEGFALDDGWIKRFLGGDRVAAAEFEHLATRVPLPVAVRSSAAGEDDRASSHAGHFTTRLNVRTLSALREAIASVATSDGREEVIGVVVQRMLFPHATGVMFTRNPETRAAEIVVEATWGIGNLVVAGDIVPDVYRMHADGTLIERQLGEKAIVSRPAAEGGTTKEPVSSESQRQFCLSDETLPLLAALAARCEAAFGAPVDVEWALTKDGLFAVQ